MASRQFACLLVLALFLPLAQAADELIVYIPGPTEDELLSQFESGSYVFNRTGIYRFDCRPHVPLDMTGTLTVIRAEDANNTTVNGSLQINMTDDFVYIPDQAVITEGTNVTWTNLEASRHNIIVYRTADYYETPEEENEEDNDTPGFALSLVLLALVIVIVGRRRSG